MINYIILEDEPTAARRLKRLLHELRPNWTCVGEADDLQSATKLIAVVNYSVIFSDIELSDCTCFDVYKNVHLVKPVIFITAYNQYAIKAFDYNGIQYLLKPIQLEQLHNAITKFESGIGNFTVENMEFIPTHSQQPKALVSKVGHKSKILYTDSIAYIVYENKTTKATLHDGTTYFIDKSIESIFDYLEDTRFFRVNRQSIVNKESIVDYHSISSNRIQLTLKPDHKSCIVVSKDKTSIFKKWIAENRI